LLALPVTALYQMVVGTGVEAVIRQRLEAWLIDLFMAWCVVVLVVDTQVTTRILGIVAMATVACVKAYFFGLAYHGTSMDAEAPILKILWLTPFVWILFESAAGEKRRSETVT
jgi:hypothetical protein